MTKQRFKDRDSELRSGRRMVGERENFMFYTYILESLSNSSRLYHGHSSDLKQRLADHNAGKCPHTAKYIPWKLKFYAAFETVELARHFEEYLKTGSGHAFSKRHLFRNTDR